MNRNLLKQLEPFCSSIPDNFKDTISNCPLGQKRTGRHKALVFLCANKIYKGPYNKKRARVLLTTLFRHEFLSEILQISVPRNLCLLFDSLNDEFYWKMDHVVCQTNTDSWKSTQQPILGYDDKKDIVNKESQGFVEFSDYLKFEKNQQFGVLWQGFWCYAYRYVLGIGDASLRNVLVDVSTKSHSITCIDYEDNRGSEPETSDDIFQLLTNKGWSTTVKNVFIAMLKRSKMFIEPELHKIYTPLFENCDQVEALISKYKMQDIVSIEIMKKRFMLLANSLENL